MKRRYIELLPMLISIMLLMGCTSSVPISSLHINSGTVRLESDMTKRLSVTVIPENTNTRQYRLVSENEFVAVCDKNSVCAANEGETYVYATTNDGKIISNKVKVIVSNEIFEVAAKIIQMSEENPDEELKDTKITTKKASEITETEVTKIPETFIVTKLTEENASDTVYITKSGTKYHTKSCSYAKTASPVPRSEAAANGLTPCQKCRP